MIETVDVCRRLWNMAIEDRKARWQGERHSTTYWQQCLMLTTEVRENSEMRSLYMQTLQDVLRRVDRAFKKFFGGKGKFPGLKKHSGWGSFTYPQAYNGGAKLETEKNRLHLSKIGNVKVVIHRSVPVGAKLKTCTVKREPDGKWFACLVYESRMPLCDVSLPRAWTSPLGVDLGLKSLITTSDGERVEPQRFFRKSERRLARLHKSLANKRPSSKNRDKARLELATRYSRVSGRRRNFNHKLSARLVRDHDLLAFEDLRIGNMVRNHSLAKSIKDASWAQLMEFVEYKAARAAKIFVKVPPAFSSQECWSCGTRTEVSLDVREFPCKGCQKILDRDRNASRVVLKRGILQVGRDKDRGGPRRVQEHPGRVAPELKPVETGSLRPWSTGAASSVVEAGTRGGNQTAESPRSENAGGCHKAAALAYPNTKQAISVDCRALFARS